MAKKQIDIIAVANKKRYASLLKKLNSEKSLTQSEIAELESYKDKYEGEKQKSKQAGGGAYFDTQKQAGAYAKVDVRTIRRWAAAGKLGKVQFKGKEVYMQSDIDKLLEEEKSQEVVKNKARLLKAEANFKEARAKRADHQLQQDLKNYVHVSLLREQRIKRIGVIKKALISAGRKLAPMVKGKKTIKEITAIINAEMQNIIRDFADGFDGSQGKDMD